MIEAQLSYRPLLDALNQAARQMTDTLPLMRQVAGIMMAAVEDNFAAQGRPRWQDLHPGTKAARAKEGKWPGQILQRSGRLASSIVQQHSARQAVVGSNVVYAAIQHFGGRTKPHLIKPKTKRALSFGGIVVRQVNHPGSRIPARPFLSLTEQDKRHLVEDVMQWYSRELLKTSLPKPARKAYQ